MIHERMVVHRVLNKFKCNFLKWFTFFDIFLLRIFQKRLIQNYSFVIMILCPANEIVAPVIRGFMLLLVIWKALFTVFTVQLIPVTMSVWITYNSLAIVLTGLLQSTLLSYHWSGILSHVFYWTTTFWCTLFHLWKFELILPTLLRFVYRFRSFPILPNTKFCCIVFVPLLV